MLDARKSMKYIATFHTHLAALVTSRTLATRQAKAWMAPVPRALSSSCGTCVCYEADLPMLEAMDGDVERVYRVAEAGQFELLFENE